MIGHCGHHNPDAAWSTIPAVTCQKMLVIRCESDGLEIYKKMEINCELICQVNRMTDGYDQGNVICREHDYNCGLDNATTASG